MKKGAEKEDTGFESKAKGVVNVRIKKDLKRNHKIRVRILNYR